MTSPDPGGPLHRERSEREGISIVEVGPRDGLQNVSEILPFETKVNFISHLLSLGFENIEAGSFVRPDLVPAMANTDRICRHFAKDNDRLWYLVPNKKGLESALDCGARQLAFFTAASETFNQRNIGMTIAESDDVIRECVSHLKKEGLSLVTDWGIKPSGSSEIKLRLYISTVVWCPYEGKIAPKPTVELVKKLLPLGFAQVSLGDTIGKGTPDDWKTLLDHFGKDLLSGNRLAMHCHDTYGTALECVSYGLSRGIRTFDSSIGGLGGCPFAPGAAGNVATENLLSLIASKGFDTTVIRASLDHFFIPSRTGNLKNIAGPL